MKKGGIIAVGGVVVGTVTALLLGRKAEGAPPEDKANLYGNVTDLDGNPLPSVKVNVDGRTVYTNIDGDYFLTGLEPGQYDVIFAKGGYQTVYR